MANHLYYGDNLDVLRESIRDESVDLIYLDPPFNSNATYNILFRAPSGQASQAQIEASRTPGTGTMRPSTPSTT
jgi:site-specific DNA-methyltransferase (adenine-specific)